MGRLILLTLPVGNLSDITNRVKTALTEGEVFAVEDTRSFKKLLQLLSIDYSDKFIQSFHEHTQDFEFWLQKMQKTDLYLCSEAGSPLISDPAYPLIQLALANEIEIDSYGGVSALNYALELCGLPIQPFTFYGFLSRERKKRNEVYLKLQAGGTFFFFESPHRIEKTVSELVQLYPKAQLAICRELSKKFQQVWRFAAKDWAKIQSQLITKGEFVLAISLPAQEQQQQHLELLAQAVLHSGGQKKDLAKLLAEILNLKSKDVYQKLV